ncbi:hypothetical protein K493DRAFT_310583 [Basidiobolus meristosporus CBS 931.73]|uniref:Uncharacterized protein n=1 Tax=Basidiobolus meristosporus CBS 931.73 TaxID=1314790 RepID=A0A1Y1Z890_9FUNG|nr:hypothetical protein K493DRAFT_310583 [Basidiobolus meristosporus CBS 931.73]|eukprot:ORY06473.1 hypothetical protein K493DRAFT_310583 [Basidiobolus meristosporus CBS 931.73]
MRALAPCLIIFSALITLTQPAPIDSGRFTHHDDPQLTLNLESLPNLDFEYIYYYAKQEMEARNYLESEINSEEA